MKKIFFTLSFVLFSTLVFSQVGIGTKTPAASSILDVNVDNLANNAKKGFCPQE